jgi:alkanesulfonate monooxygenase SsuD/methylene tetrahydromethanopterin reductase-like flavin-dependent oxidoreductase (luciferase family)
VATAAEDLGFDAFFRSDHYLAMDTDGGPGPTDAWVTLAGLARETTRIRLGTLVSPVTFRLSCLDQTGEAFTRVRAACAEAVRDERSIVYSVAQTVCCGEDESAVVRRATAIGRDAGDLRRTALGGTPDQIVDRIGRFAEIGASRVYLQVLDLDDLDHLALLSDRVLSQVG